MQKRMSPRHKTLLTKIILTIVLIAVITVALLSCFTAVYIRRNILPNAEINLSDYGTTLTSVIYYTDPYTGVPQELQTLYGTENRTWVTYDEIPAYMWQAAVAIEDKRFLKHNGVDWLRTGSAFVNMFMGMRSSFGASTITQQAIRNVTGYKDGTVERKLTEIFRALELERNYSKQEILEWYLNYIYLSEGCYGVCAAAETYFNKELSQLTLAECASIIGITNNPSMYDPYLNPEANKKRQELILGEMLKQHYITKDQYAEAVAQELVFQRPERSTSTVYSWYVDQVITDVLNDLKETYGVSDVVAGQMLYGGGYSIYCNIDLNVQQAVDNIYSNSSNLQYNSASSGQALQSAITVIDPYTGHVVALSGGVGEKTTSRAWNRATSTRRQPGSSIKPLSVYSPAIELGVALPNTVLDDSPFMLMNDTAWPVNADGVYGGLTTVANGLRLSKNTIAVKTLDKVGLENSFEFLKERYHISSLVEESVRGDTVYSDLGYAQLGLGGLTTGVSTLEMAAAYATFVNDGIYIEPTTYTKVIDSNGTVVLDKSAPQASVAISESTCYYINQMLQGAVRSGTGTGAQLPNMAVAGKTGTTTSKKDTWFVGYTPYYVAAVWVGYDISERVNLSVNQAPLMWKAVMAQVHEGLEYKDFKVPGETVTVNYCLDCGKLAASACSADPRGSRVTAGTFLKGDQPTEYCTCHVYRTICPSGHAIAGPYCPVHRTVALVNYSRTTTYGASVADSSYLLSSYYSSCHIHTHQYVPPAPDDGGGEAPVDGGGEAPVDTGGGGEAPPAGE
ncbi:MAG: PBP1A family penicillin-binding protein [Oscillospiraceae bacterium]|nr:PBP1A family penicillin-binding protein [Oscillospiraceae bacterium]